MRDGAVVLRWKCVRRLRHLSITLNEIHRSEGSVFSQCRANHDEDRYAHARSLSGTKTSFIHGLK